MNTAPVNGRFAAVTLMRSLRWVAGVLVMALVVQPALADPPGRVGRISIASGDVQFRNTHTGDSEQAQVNWPVTGRNVILTGADGLAEVQVGSTSLRIDRDSEIEFAALDDEQVRVRVIAGRLAVRVRNPEKLDDFDLRMPHGRFIPEQVGLYRIETRGERDSSSASVLAGAGRLDTAGRSTRIAAGGRADVSGTVGTLEVRLTDAGRDPFDDWNLALDRRVPAPRATRYVSPEMTGHEALDEYGEWRESPEHGSIWVPHAAGLPADWAPYRWGRWAWVEPWGWTWVDAAPWGFAPSHYGRWVYSGSYWGWAPGGMVARPVYAPALVGWVGGPGAALTVRSGPGVGWFPLGPGEAFHPYYAYSPNYLHRVNRGIAVVPPAAVAPGPVAPRWRHATLPQAVTMVPAEALTARRPITPAFAAPVTPQSLQAVPVAPAATTLAPPRPAFETGRRHVITAPAGIAPGSPGPGVAGTAPRIAPPASVAPSPPSAAIVPPARMHPPEPAVAPRAHTPHVAAPVPMHVPSAPARVHTPVLAPSQTPAPVQAPVPVAPRMESPRVVHQTPVHVSPPVMQAPRPVPHAAPPAAALRHAQPPGGGGGNQQRRSRDGK